MAWRYLIALGSNRRHHRFGRPEQVLSAALVALNALELRVLSSAVTIRSAPAGPSWRTYANTAAVIETVLDPEELLVQLKEIERNFGRRPGGQRWGSRVLDLDIVLWSGGAWASPGLIVPHTAFRDRTFVLQPASQVAPGWRDPLTGLTLRHLATRLSRRLTRQGPAPR